jgi:hypothetical protein
MYLAQHGERMAANEQPVEDPPTVLEQGGGTPSDPKPQNIFQEMHGQSDGLPLRWD